MSWHSLKNPQEVKHLKSPNCVLVGRGFILRPIIYRLATFMKYFIFFSVRIYRKRFILTKHFIIVFVQKGTNRVWKYLECRGMDFYITQDCIYFFIFKKYIMSETNAELILLEF